MEIRVSNKITVTEPNDDVKAYCYSKLKIANPEYQQKQRMGKWTGNTPSTIYLYEKVGNKLILPFGCIYDVINMHPIIPDFKPAESVDYKTEIPLYDYQREAVDHMSKYVNGILKAPAGSGKTQMGIAMICEYGKRALWLTHTQDLLKQSYNRAKQYLSEEYFGTITAGKVNIGKGITFATVQTMSHIDLSEYKDYWDMIIVDECHRVAGSPSTITQFSKVLNALSARRKYGLSATVHRADGMIRATFAMLGEIRYSIPDEAVNGKIVAVGIKPIKTECGVSYECLNTDGTINYAKLISHLASNNLRCLQIVDNLIANKDHSVLILSHRLEHLEHMRDLLPRAMQEDSVLISGQMQSKTAKAEREAAIQQMRDGTKKYMFATYSLAKEGLDIPRLDRLFMATPVKDYAVTVQSVGRIARAYEGKESPICYDFVDNMPYLIKAFKTRCRHYNKCGCYIVSDV